MSDAFAPAILRYVAAVCAADTGQWRGRSATFWLSLGLDRGSDAQVALVRDAFRSHGIVVSTSEGELGHEPPEAWIELATIPLPHDRGTSITDLPDALFGHVSDPDPQPSRPVANEHLTAAPSSTDVSPIIATSPDELTNPATTTTATVKPRTVGTLSDGSSDIAPWICCPSCGARVLLSALFCPVCNLPRTHVQERLHQRAAATGEAYPVLQDHVRRERWPLPDQRQPLNAAARAWVAIGFLVLGVGAGLDNLLALVLVLAGMGVLSVAVFKPERLDAVMGQGASRRSRTVAGEVVGRLAMAMTFIVVMLLLWAGVAIVGMMRGTLLP